MKKKKVKEARIRGGVGCRSEAVQYMRVMGDSRFSFKGKIFIESPGGLSFCTCFSCL
jgi:hypothetical protein